MNTAKFMVALPASRGGPIFGPVKVYEGKKAKLNITHSDVLHYACVLLSCTTTTTTTTDTIVTKSPQDLLTLLPLSTIHIYHSCKSFPGLLHAVNDQTVN